MNATYEVHSVGDLARSALRIVAYVAPITVVIGVVGGHWWVVPVVLVALLVFSRSSLSAAWTPLRVDPTGIGLSFPLPVRSGREFASTERRFVAWSVVHRIEVDPVQELVRVVLRADAPLPPWQSGRIIDVTDPDSGPTLERRVPGVQAAALHRAVLDASPSTPVVTR